jgi:hypothetical protein
VVAELSPAFGKLGGGCPSPMNLKYIIKHETKVIKNLNKHKKKKPRRNKFNNVLFCKLPIVK